MVAHQTLTLFVRVRILHPLPPNPLELYGSRGFLCLFDPYQLEVLNVLHSNACHENFIHRFCLSFPQVCVMMTELETILG